ncbi:type III-B CRISPR module RAMP protein Cmr6 [Candidatus Caldatribacterium saccharofermentans]|uniref:type III-B CRISPR module RAMP protein Cmr6 n=1 Tax=Candidatus Caldatribacterium saccharofermentans TaxID=1454753 RepID=UPI003CFE7A90
MRPAGQQRRGQRAVTFLNPSDTREILRGLFDEEGFRFRDTFPKNVALIFSKLIPVSEEKGNKAKHLGVVQRELEHALRGDILRHLEKKVRTLVGELGEVGYKSCEIPAETVFRLVVGLGGVHPEETSMIFHHVYGIPYIPGSAVKGVTRQWAVRRMGEEVWQKNRDVEWDDILEYLVSSLERGVLEEREGWEIGEETQKEFKKAVAVFGTQEHEGGVIFLDAYPVRNLRCKLDIMNPHYAKYYEDENNPEIPGDWLSPVPIPFLTVDSGTEFLFFLLSRDSELFDAMDLLDTACSWLKEALEKEGLGAKGSLGYGRFRILSSRKP